MLAIGYIVQFLYTNLRFLTLFQYIFNRFGIKIENTHFNGYEIIFCVKYSDFDILKNTAKISLFVKKRVSQRKLSKTCLFDLVV